MNKQRKQDTITSTPQQNVSRTRRITRWVWRKKWWVLIAIFLLIAGCMMFGNKTERVQFATVNITRGNLRYIVTATGEIQPLNTVSVGSQVSGTIAELFVDYNSKVKQGDILLKIEPSVLQASVDEARATLTSAESQRNYAKSEYMRNKTLYSDGYISRA